MKSIAAGPLGGPALGDSFRTVFGLFRGSGREGPGVPGGADPKGPDPPTLPLWQKCKGDPQKSKGVSLCGTPKSLKNKGKTHRKSKENRKTKKSKEIEKAGIGGSGGICIKLSEIYFPSWDKFSTILRTLPRMYKTDYIELCMNSARAMNLPRICATVPLLSLLTLPIFLGLRATPRFSVFLVLCLFRFSRV